MSTDVKPIRLGMVGGGKDAFIGAVHRIAMRIDGQYELVAGALSSTPQKAFDSGVALGLPEDRIYADFKEMAIAEAAREDGIEAVAIVTPNHMHFAAAQEFLSRGIHVICDKPLTSTMDEANKMAEAVAQSDAMFLLTHNYTGYPLMRQAREMVAAGDLGDIRVVQVEYAQDWLTEAAESKQADWRTDPSRSGAGGATGDIGTHAFNLACFVSDLEPQELCADLQSFVPGRRVDDNAHVMLRFKGGARGMLWCSQVAPGKENALKLSVFGSKGGIEWSQEVPNQMLYTPFGSPSQILTRAGAGASASSEALTRTPGGHPEGYLEAFANLYLEAADLIRDRRDGQPKPLETLVPGLKDGMAGMRFVDACVRSSAQNSAWVSLAET